MNENVETQETFHGKFVAEIIILALALSLTFFHVKTHLDRWDQVLEFVVL